MTGRSGFRNFAFVALLWLVACADQQTGFRDTSEPIGATTRFDAAEFSGRWIVTASFSHQQKQPIVVSTSTEAGALQIESEAFSRIVGLYREGATGELIPLASSQETLVVMWVDDDFRTAAVGTASGSIGLVLDRSGEIPEDRAKAVRDILAFYGWDISQLKRTF